MNRQTTKDIIESAINDYIKSEQLDIALFNNVRQSLMNFDGKQINKRMATAVEKKLSIHKVRYDTNYNMFHIEIWIDGNYNNHKRFLLGHRDYQTGSAPIFTLENFDDHNACMGSAAEKRILQCMETLEQIDKLNPIIDNYIKAKEAYANLSNFDIPALYAILDKLGIKN